MNFLKVGDEYINPVFIVSVRLRADDSMVIHLEGGRSVELDDPTKVEKLQIWLTETNTVTDLMDQKARANLKGVDIASLQDAAKRR